MLPARHVDVSDLRDLSFKLALLATEQRATVLPKVLNDVGDRAYTQVIRSVAAATGVQQKRVRAVTKKQLATANHLYYSVRSRDTYLPLKAFNPKQGRKGVSVRVWEKRRTLPHTFIGHGSLNEHVYVRKGEIVIASKGRYKGKRREKLHLLYGPAIPKEMLKDAVIQATMMAVERRVKGAMEYWTDKAWDKAKAAR